MNKNKIPMLLERFLSFRATGKNAYFDADEIEDLLDSFEEQDDYTYYDEVLKLGLQLHPQNQELTIRLCDSLVEKEQFSDALEMMNSINYEHIDLDKLRLECLFMLGKFDLMNELLRKRSNEKCDYMAELFDYIIPVAIDEEYYVKAEQLLQDAMAMFPDNLSFKTHYRYVLEALKKYDEAIVICNELIDKDPYSSEQWDSLGRLYSLTQQFDKAIEAFEFALTCEQDSPAEEREIKMLHAFCLYMNKSYEKAIDAYMEFDLENEAIKKEVLPMLAECYIRMDQIETGYELLRSYLQIFDSFDDPNYYMHFIRCAMELGHEEEGRREVENAARFHPDDLALLSMLLLIYIGEQETEKAEKLYHRILDLLKGSVFLDSVVIDNLINTGVFLIKNEDTEMALELFLQLIELNPNTYPELYVYVSMIHMEKGDISESLRYAKLAEMCQNNEEMLDRKITDDELENIQLDMQTFIDLIHAKIPEIQLTNRDAKNHNVSKALVYEFLNNKDNKN